MHAVHECPGGTCHKLDVNVGIKTVVARKDRGQPRCSRAFERANSQRAARLTVAERRLRFRRKPQHLIGVREQQFAFLRKHESPAIAHEEPCSELVFKLPYPGGDIRRHAVETFGGLVDAALLDHGLEDLESGEVHGKSVLQTRMSVLYYSLLLRGPST